MSITNRPLTCIALVAVMAVGIGCSKEKAKSTEPLPPNTVSTGGGTLTFDGGAMTLRVPAGALARPVTFTALVEQTIPEGLASRLYTLGPSGTEFSQPAEIRIRIDTDAIEDIANLEDVSGAVFAEGIWHGVPATVDAVTGEVVFSVMAIGEPETLPIERSGSSIGRGGGAAVGYFHSSSGPEPTCDFDIVLASGMELGAMVPKYVTANGTGSDILAGTVTQPWATLSNAVARLQPGQKLVVRSGGEFVNQPDTPPGLGVETFPIELPHHAVIEGQNARVRIRPAAGATTVGEVFRVTTSPNFSYVSGLTIEADVIPNVPAGNLNRDRIATIATGSPTFRNISSQSAGGYRIDGTAPDIPMSIRGGSLRGSSARIDVYGGKVNVLNTSFQATATYADAESAAVFVEDGDVCVEGINAQGSPYMIHAARSGHLNALNARSQGGDMGVFFGRIPVDPQTTVTYEVRGCTFQGYRRAGVATATPTSSVSLADNTYDGDPPIVWHGAPPFFEPVDIAHLLNPFGNPRWWPLNRPEPTARFGADIGYDPSTGVFILFGGRAGASPFDDTWSFDTRSFTWTEVTTTSIPPDARYEYMMASVPAAHATTDNVFLVGGHTGAVPDVIFPMDEIWRYESVSGDWSRNFATGDVPSPRYGATWIAAEEDPYIYLYGGIDSAGNVLNDMYRYVIATKTWELMTPVGTPLPRAFHGGAAYPGGIAYFGGLTVAGGDPTDDMATVKTGQTYRTVVQSGASPGPRAFHTFGRVLNRDTGQPRFVVFGGAPPGGGEFLGSAYVFHVDEPGATWDEGFWTTINTTPDTVDPTPRGRSMMLEWIEPSRPHDNILVFGGVGNTGNPIGASFLYMAGGTE